MGFVDDERVVLRQSAIAVTFCEQNVVGHHFDQGVFLHAIGEANFVADQLAQLRLQLLRDARGCVQPMVPWLPRLSCKQIFGN